MKRVQDLVSATKKDSKALYPGGVGSRCQEYLHTCYQSCPYFEA